VPHLALLLAEPAALRPALLKLDWSPPMAELPAGERSALAAALERIGPERVVLHRADSEAALRWGLAQGVRRFQGRHVDAMLAARRMVACPHAARCGVNRCVEQANLPVPPAAGCAPVPRASAA
jgi:hypothetical protein